MKAKPWELREDCFRKVGDWYKPHRQAWLARRRRYWLNKYKSSVGCNHCNIKVSGEGYAFDHINPTSKKANVAAMITNAHPLSTIINEVRKCQVLCHNCHVKKTILEEDNSHMSDESRSARQTAFNKYHSSAHSKNKDKPWTQKLSYFTVTKRDGWKYDKRMWVIDVKRDILNDIKAKSGCIRCSETDVSILTFDHRDPSTKSDNLAVMVKYKDDPDHAKLLLEADKCDVLCQVCHHLKTHDDRQLKSNKARETNYKEYQELLKQNNYESLIGSRNVNSNLTKVKDIKGN